MEEVTYNTCKETHDTTYTLSIFNQFSRSYLSMFSTLYGRYHSCNKFLVMGNVASRSLV